MQLQVIAGVDDDREVERRQPRGLTRRGRQCDTVAQLGPAVAAREDDDARPTVRAQPACSVTRSTSTMKLMRSCPSNIRIMRSALAGSWAL